MNGTQHSTRRRPRGTTLLEIAVAGVLLTALAAICLKYVAAAAEHRRTLLERQAAWCEAANMMERIAACPWSDLSADRFAQQPLAPESAALLPAAKLEVEIADSAGPPASKRITVHVRWPGPNPSAPPMNVQLTGWRFAPDAGGAEFEKPD